MTSDPLEASVRIITRNAETALSLRAYLWHHNVEATVDDTFDAVRGTCTAAAILVFPDEFPELQALEGVAALVGRVRKTQVIVVTREIARFDRLVVEHGSREPARLVILPRPVWGWVLLEQVQRSLEPGVDPLVD